MDIKYKQSPVLIIGNGRLSHSVCVCLIKAKHPVTLFTENKDDAVYCINGHFFDLFNMSSEKPDRSLLQITNSPDCTVDYGIGIAITGERLNEKIAAIRELEKKLFADSVIAINTESIPLNILQEACDYPERLIGVNWAEPAHTTYFLEIITNANSSKEAADDLFSLAKTQWNKDPYLISNGVSVRAKMLGVMAREAFYLVQNGYASIEDIDRACRNDAGYYLPFSGNFRYMDLMGTYAYGLVMKDLNRELSKEDHVPVFFEEIIEQGGLGMENNKGFYKYEEGDAKRWNEMFVKFSYQIQHIISKYPFNYKEKAAVTDTKTSCADNKTSSL
jgi:3-hydroxybutyryl-CoA dehydrogenase